MIRYSGVFASNSRLRKQIVPKQESDANEPEPSKHPASKKHWNWAKLMRRVFEIDVRECPRCMSQMQTISFITEGKVIWNILASLKMATAPPEPKPSQFINEQDDFFLEPECDYSQETWA